MMMIDPLSLSNSIRLKSRKRTGSYDDDDDDDGDLEQSVTSYTSL